jgi:hypothetical protein
VPPSLPVDVITHADTVEPAQGPEPPRPRPANLSATSGAAGRRARAGGRPTAPTGPAVYAVSSRHPGWVVTFNPDTLAIHDFTNVPTITHRAAKECARLGIAETVPLAIMADRTVVASWYGADGRPLAKAVSDAAPGYAVVFNPATLRVILIVPADADLPEL